MAQTFNDQCNERKQQMDHERLGFILWTFVDTAFGIIQEHMVLIMKGTAMNTLLAKPGSAALLSSILLAVTIIVAPWIYLTGNLRDPLGSFSYGLADFMYGPVWGASLVTLVYILREYIGARAPHRMSLALLAAVLSAGVAILIACIRSANRHYHVIHPELHLENSSAVLTVWTTLVAGLTGASWHFLGWALVLIGSAGWTSGSLPRLLSMLYLLAGIASLFVYLRSDLDGLAALLGIIVSIWQGILLWKSDSGERQASQVDASQPHPG
jgi:hypothetical protein